MKRLPRLSRRALLRSAGGIAIALPWLEQMLPASASAATAVSPKRFMAVFFPSGFVRSGFRPATTGSSYTLSPTLTPLESYQSDFLVLSGLDKKVADSSHHGGTSGLLTATGADEATAQLTPDALRPTDRSIDQLIADQVGGSTRKRSIHTLVTPEPYACGDLCGNISWSDKSTPLGTEGDPKALFDSMFSGFTAPSGGGPSPDQLLAAELDKSILDFVSNDTAALRAKVGTADQKKLDEYLDGIRSLEQQLAAPGGAALSCTVGAAPAATTDPQQQVKNMIDVLTLGLACDITRVSTMMVGFGRGNWVFDFLGVTGGHHDDCSHHGGDQAKIDDCLKIEKWQMEQFAYLLGRLKGFQEGDGTLLDNTIVYMSSDVSDGNAHDQKDLPILLAGRGGGTLSPGRHINYPDLPNTNLFVSILNAMDVPTTQYNDSTGPLTDLAG